jgi:hypothetical protein
MVMINLVFLLLCAALRMKMTGAPLFGRVAKPVAFFQLTRTHKEMIPLQYVNAE